MHHGFTAVHVRRPKPLSSNQWTLGDDVTVDPSQSSFRKAMGLANGTVSVMDKNAVCFSRVWCVFEIAESILKAAVPSYSYGESTQPLHVLLPDHLLSRWPVPLHVAPTKSDMYTALPPEQRMLLGRSAVGITDGLAAADMNQARVKAERERHFPSAVNRKAIGTKLQDGQATVESDRRHVWGVLCW